MENSLVEKDSQVVVQEDSPVLDLCNITRTPQVFQIYNESRAGRPKSSRQPPRVRCS